MFDVSATNTKTRRQIVETAEDHDEAQVMARKMRERKRPDGTPMYERIHIDERLFALPEGERQLKLF